MQAYRGLSLACRPSNFLLAHRSSHARPALAPSARPAASLQQALAQGRYQEATDWLQHRPLPRVADVLVWLEQAGSRARAPSRTVLPLYGLLVKRQPLTPAEWARVPAPCPGLGAALPAVLARSEAEAALLAARLPAADRERLHTAALCLRRVEREHGLDLPPAILRLLLPAAVAEQVDHRCCSTIRAYSADG